ncbi:MAG TPA: HEAT repeat domain-containing protein, partial [Gemmatales bacterium]|nr:HEAT repeat domain-containing protein [Gemmatales bacterium]
MKRKLQIATSLFAALLLAVSGQAADGQTQLEQLTQELKSSEAVKKRKAIKQIGEMGTAAKSLAPLLITILENERDVLVRRGTAEALGNIGGDRKQTISALARALKDADEEVIHYASTSLSKFGKDAVPALRQALKEKDNKVRQHAAEAIARIGPEAKDAVPDLLNAYKAEAPNMRRGNIVKATYVIALGNIGPEAKDAIPV